jgi:hypothetical protein
MSTLKLSKQMERILLVLREEKQPIRTCEIILKTRNMNSANSTPNPSDLGVEDGISAHNPKYGKRSCNRVASDVAHRKVPDAMSDGWLRFAHLHPESPRISPEEVRKLSEKAEDEKRAIKEADRHYASFCRSLKTLSRLWLVKEYSLPVRTGSKTFPAAQRRRSFSYRISDEGLAELTKRLNEKRDSNSSLENQPENNHRSK